MIAEATFNTKLKAQMIHHHAGRHDLPPRVLIGTTKKSCLHITTLLSYADHVAALALIAKGYHPHTAAMRVVREQAGAYEGNLSQFDHWEDRKHLNGQAVVTKLPDGTNWVIWRGATTKLGHSRRHQIPMVLGWDGGPCELFHALALTKPLM